MAGWFSNDCLRLRLRPSTECNSRSRFFLLRLNATVANSILSHHNLRQHITSRMRRSALRHSHSPLRRFQSPVHRVIIPSMSPPHCRNAGQRQRERCHCRWLSTIQKITVCGHNSRTLKERSKPCLVHSADTDKHPKQHDFVLLAAFRSASSQRFSPPTAICRSALSGRIKLPAMSHEVRRVLKRIVRNHAWKAAESRKFGSSRYTSTNASCAASSAR